MRLAFAILSLVLFTRPSGAEDIVIRAGKVYTSSADPLAPGAVLVKDGKIAAVASDMTPGEGARLIDLGKGVLLPGFIDAFTSIGIEGGVSERTREITPSFRVLDGVDWSSRAFRQALAEGTTTVVLTPGSDNVIAGLSCAIKTAGDRSRRVVSKEHSLILTTASDPAAGNSARNRPDSIYNRQPTNRMGVVWMLRAEFSRARSSRQAETDPLVVALTGKRPMVCVSRLDCDIMSALRLRDEFSLPMTIAGGQEAYKIRDVLAGAKIPVLLGKLSTTPGTGPENSEPNMNAAGLLHEAGVVVALTGGQLLEQARFAYRAGMPASAAIAAITSTPARLLGVDNRLGSIEVGRDADFVALSADPFELASDIRWTMIDGVIRSEDK